MQKITVKEVKGPLGKGEKKFYAVVDTEGAEFTTFDSAVKQITPGSILEIEPEVKGKYLNIKEFKVIEEGAGESKASTNGGGYKRDTEGIEFEYRLKARLEQIKNASIEAQTAYNGIITAACAGKLLFTGEVAMKAFKWAEAKLDASMKAPAAEPKPVVKSEMKVETGKGEEVDPDAPFANVGKLLQWCDDKDIDRPTFMEIVGCTEASIAKVNIPDAYQKVKERLEEKIF